MTGILMIKGYMILFGSIFLALAACQSLPAFSRSGEVRDIAISTPLSVAAILVNVGDEVRWTNKLLTPVRITFLDYVLNMLSCRSNFEGHFYSGADAALQPNESASLCFYKLGTIRYVVRMEHRNGEISESGLVQVGAFKGMGVCTEQTC